MILRWLLVLVLLAASGAALVGVERGAERLADKRPVDEILAYEIGRGQTVSAELPSGIESIVVTTWGVLGRRREARPEDRYHYGVSAELHEPSGVVAERRSYHVQSRISGDPLDPDAPFAARPAYGSDWVTDPRTLEIDTRPLSLRGGRVVLRATAEGLDRVLIRLAYEQPRSSVEQQLVAQRLTEADHRQLVEGRASLGFDDLPVEAQLRALGSWRRRLAASGNKGVDYVQRRLLLGSLRDPPAPVVEEAASVVELAPWRAAVLNVTGSPAFNIEAPASARLSLNEAGIERTVKVGEDGRARVELAAGGPRSVLILADEPTTASIEVPADKLSSLLGNPTLGERSVGGAQFYPEVRRLQALRLDPHVPLTFDVGATQPAFGFTLRAVYDSLEDHAKPLRAGLRLEWWSGEQRLGRDGLGVQLAPSSLAWTESGQPITEALTRLVSPPRGADRMLLYGPRHLLASVWTNEPGVPQSQLDPSYESALPDGLAWRYPRYLETRWATLAPRDRSLLESDDRSLTLVAQTRLERSLSESAPLPERALLPQGALIERRSLSPVYVRPGAAVSSSLCTPLEGTRALRVPSEGSAAGLLSVDYVADAGCLGRSLKLEVDGETAAEQRLVFSSGRLQAPTPPGVHQVALRSACSQLSACAEAAPEEGGSMLKSLTLYELRGGQNVEFLVNTVSDQVSWILLFVATECVGQSFGLDVAIDGGRPRLRLGQFFRRSTTPRSTLSGTSGDAGRLFLWQADEPPQLTGSPPDGLSRARILLGDDLAPGQHVVHVFNPGVPRSGRLWIRAVVVGERPAAPQEGVRAWTIDAP